MAARRAPRHAALGLHAPRHVGGGGRVVHYAGWSRALLGGPVEEVPVLQFTGGREVMVVPQHAVRYAAAEIVARARSRLGEDRYRVVSNNCEHFCAWCVSGESRSARVEGLLGGLRRVASAATRRLVDLFGRGLKAPRTANPLVGAALD